MNTEERRAPGTSRKPFDALVEVGGDLGPTFEAQAVNISEDGIQLRTAYLPEPGQALTCRFDSGPERTVLAAGEVVWAQGGDQGGEFAVRFTEVDAESVEAIKGLCGISNPAVPAPAGARVRLHIEGLASPMRAKVKDSKTAAVTVGSELGFLQVGRPLELEDTDSGNKRPASIDRVDVVVDKASNVPQLVVTLRYTDLPARATEAAPPPAQAAVVERSVPVDVGDFASPTRADAVTEEMKGWVASGIERAGRAVGQFAERAKTTMAILRKTEGRSPDAPRRTTSLPPGGGLHATGRRVVRGEQQSSPAHETASVVKAPNIQRRAVLAGAVMAVAILGALAIKKSHHDAPQASVASTDDPTKAAPSAAAAAPPTAAPPAPAAGVVASATASPAPEAPPAVAPPTPATETADNGGDKAKKRIHVPPFSNGPVHHGNVFRLKMDGAIEAIEGAQQPTGFTVKVPGRRSLEAAAPLAARDARIAAIKVSNDAAGAELTVAFKDGVPNYRVSAKGEELIIALAPAAPMPDETLAKKDEKGSKSPKHRKHEHGAGSATSTEQQL
jgi:hypothetical protein